MGATLIKGEQIQITDFIKAMASVNWSSDNTSPSAAAVLAKIQSEIAGVSGAMQFRGAWTQAATDSTAGTNSANTIKKGYVYVYEGNGTAPTGVTLENGDTLIAKQDAASPTNSNHWTVVQVNITGAVTLSNLVGNLLDNVVGSGSISITAPTTGANAGKLVITGAFPTISNPNAVNGQYVTGMSIDANGVITLTRGTPPDYRNYNVVGEIPSGTMNGSNTTFVTSKKPHSTDLIAVYVNGVRQKAGSGNDYRVSIPSSGTNANKGVITFESGAYIPQSGDSLLVDYTAEDLVTANS